MVNADKISVEISYVYILYHVFHIIVHGSDRIQTES